MKRNRWLVAGGVAASAAAWYFYATSRFGVRKVPYTILEKDGRFELREYPPLHVAYTRDETDDRAFRRLIGYISRGNTHKLKIAMTTPVLVDREPGRNAMAFVMPPGTAVPDPLDDAVKIGTRPGERVAVLRFRGGRGRDGEQRAVERLRRAIAERGLETEGDPIVAYYDAPWTPPPLRRNEVMLRLEASSP